ncbi:MAG: TIGR03790 family protein, partial [Fimbriiglobus sp.]
MTFRHAFALVVLFPAAASALEPRDVVVVFNTAVPASRAVADHYAAARKVPAGNLVGLDLPAGEDISRDDFNRKLAGPLREKLRDRKARVRVLLTVYGVPLRVGGASQTDAEKQEIAALAPKIDAARKKLTELSAAQPPDKLATAAANGELSALIARRQTLSHAESTASVDSELMLLWWPEYPLARQ